MVRSFTMMCLLVLNNTCEMVIIQSERAPPLALHNQSPISTSSAVVVTLASRPRALEAHQPCFSAFSANRHPHSRAGGCLEGRVGAKIPCSSSSSSSSRHTLKTACTHINKTHSLRLAAKQHLVSHRQPARPGHLNKHNFTHWHAA